LLNPFGNVPLKMYEVEPENLDKVIGDGWSPCLYLTKEERGIVEAEGTVLLLGRSGTGKTICIINRMDWDKQRFKGSSNFTQLFVARSRRLCRYVSLTVGEKYPADTFTTFGQVLQSIEYNIPKVIKSGSPMRETFLASQKMDFPRFQRDVYSGCDSQPNETNIDALLVWTNIKSFLKGSIEALLEPNQIMTKENFLALGRRRCRLGQAQRGKVYEIFQKYQNICSAQNLWDDCDRICALLLRLQNARESEDSTFNALHRNKIYVDEIQDYTQAEIYLFFLLCGAGDLFLAGDPAQSVVEGVEFRFEDIRSVGYHVSSPATRDLIPNKPKTVTTNFRSHSGVMDTAAAILNCMFTAFPYSAKQLPEDKGLFSGPRPGVFHGVKIDQLKALVNGKLSGVVVITHDSSVRYVKNALGNYQLVYGIRAAKGLEFKSVIILDFFSELPQEFQKPWRNLLLGRDDDVLKPELEGQLKLLYTAVTRCIEQLFFAETTRTSSSDAFVRWSTTTSIRSTTLATRQNVDNVEKMVFTQDEWIASGLDNAEMAESYEETNIFDNSLALIEKALFCFEQGKEHTLAQRARTHRIALLFQRDLLKQAAASSSLSSSSLLSSSVAIDQYDTKTNGNIEIRIAELTRQLLSESLLLGALRLIKFTLPYLEPYSKEHLENIIIPKLLDIEKMGTKRIHYAVAYTLQPDR